jgi:hypothetical protein
LVVDPRAFVTPPTQEESLALQLAARYLMRAGTEAASKLMRCEPPDVRAELWASLSDSLLSSAALCDGLTDSEAEMRYARLAGTLR